MLRYALRRILWAIPTLLATSLVLFFVTTLAPDSSFVGAGALDLPRFVNSDPQDVRSRARAAIEHVAGGDDQRAMSEQQLRRMGGAALPYVLPMLQALPPETRGRAALALAPIAERMGIAAPDDLKRPEDAALFWTHFWDDRALDFAQSAVDRAVMRLVEHGSDLRESDLVALDTFALSGVVRAIGTTDDRTALARLTRIARHAAGRGALLYASSSDHDVRRARADWREWWFVHATDFVPLDGSDRAIAVITETRYGKWLRRAVSGELGVSAVDGEPILDKLSAHAPVTVVVCALAMLASWAIAIPVGVVGAWRHRRAFDVATSAAMFVLYATPTFAVAIALRTMASVDGARVAFAVLALALSSVAMLSRWQRAAMLEVLRADYVRSARAKGLPPWRVAALHVLRNALAPAATIAGLQLPALVGGALVVEEVFGLPGIGFETMRAVEAHDAAWLMAVVIAAAAAVTFGLIASDLAYAAIDPRVREVLVRRQQGGHAP